ncbi:amidohydrolase family protein [Sediminicoccus rosea]|jgi:aminocarboxymuconate-semialdehyde decarboxylase|uniref:Amidohydrolase family protein n=1 Tax=Sediminicoccus rosea TaxID=1225128 RepID=A0ABZ0PE35_9PROT|nr:amidohydrolase family protein [Sediminicoccus rosea]WPB83889.1 amidohydrolase family protein [Sediminicoccus rosea]
MIIDAHTHTLCPGVNPMVAGRPELRSIPYNRDMEPESAAVDQAQFPELSRRFLDIATRREDMARMGVDHQVVMPAPGQQHYWAEPDLLVALSRAQNEHVAGLVAAGAGAFTGIGTLPMTAPERAPDEAARAVEELGLKGFQIDTRAGAMELSDPALDPLWARLARLGAALVLHPLGFSDGARLGRFFMVNTVGNPLEEVIAANHLTLGGVLDRHPELRVKIVHGGGFYPFLAGRLDHAWRRRPELRRLTSEPPSAYLSRLWYDTVVFDPRLLRMLFELVGPGRIMLGSDYPFDMGEDDPRATLATAGLPAEEVSAIESGTARRFFGI